MTRAIHFDPNSRPSERLTQTELEALLGELAQLYYALSAHGPELLDLERLVRVDGYPSRASGSEGRGRSNTIDDDGTPIDVQDFAVGELVVNRLAGQSNGPSRAAIDLRYHLRHAIRELHTAERIVRHVVERPRVDDAVSFDDWCRSCLTIGQHVPVHRSERCHWCYDFWRAERIDPPKQLLRYHHEGRRITAAMVDDALGRRRSA